MSRLKQDLKRLLDITKDCREDMHEPDEKGLSAEVIGNHLDNAMGEQITITEHFFYQEFLVKLKVGQWTETFNLANLIALARKAQLSNTQEELDKLKEKNRLDELKIYELEEKIRLINQLLTKD